MACTAFRKFVARGRVTPPTPPATRAIYNEIFNGDDFNMEKTISFKKRDHALQVATGIVYVPLTIDSQGDFMTAAGIEKSAHGFIAQGITKNIDVNHDGVLSGSAVVESFIAKQNDEHFPQGAWVVGVKIPDPALWAAVVAGQLTGLSLMGKGERTETKLNGKPAKRIDNLEVDSISLVPKAANKETFQMLKSDKQGDEFLQRARIIAARLEKTAKDMTQRFETTMAELERP